MKNKKILNISLLCFTYASLLICFLVAACVGLVIPSATASTVNIGLYQIKQGGASFVLSPASGAVIAFMVISAISFVATLFFNKNVRKVEFVSLFSLVIVFSILLLSSKPNETSIMNQIAQWDGTSTLHVHYGWIFQMTLKPGEYVGNLHYQGGGYFLVVFSVVIGILYALFACLQTKSLIKKTNKQQTASNQ